MSMRSVEMQIAIPRTSEAGNVQNQLLQKPVYDQAALAAKSIARNERDLKRSVQVSDAAGVKIRDDSPRGSNGGRSFSSSRRKTGPGDNGAAAEGLSVPSTDHPYKGRHIDLSL